MSLICRQLIVFVLVFLSSSLRVQDEHAIKVWPSKARLNYVVNIQIDHVASLVKREASGKPAGCVPFLGHIPLKGLRLYPAFDATLLTLMGISSGAYGGFKFA